MCFTCCSNSSGDSTRTGQTSRTVCAGMLRAATTPLPVVETMLWLVKALVFPFYTVSHLGSVRNSSHHRGMHEAT